MMESDQQKCIQNHNYTQRSHDGNTSSFAFSTAPADGLAPLGVKASAGKIMTKVSLHIYTEPALDGKERSYPLSHWGQDKMTVILKTTLSNPFTFSWIKIVVFGYKFRWKLFKGPINNMPSLVQIMAWCWTGDKPLSPPNHGLVYWLMHISFNQYQQHNKIKETKHLLWKRHIFALAAMILSICR